MKPTIDDKTHWWLCDRCAVRHYGMGGMLFGCERTCMSVKPTTSGKVDPRDLCKHYEPKVEKWASSTTG
jgi:hypothetical protein